jgi:hypothetical protein
MAVGNASSYQRRACRQQRQAYAEDIGCKTGIEAVIRPGEAKRPAAQPQAGRFPLSLWLALT